MKHPVIDRSFSSPPIMLQTAAFGDRRNGPRNLASALANLYAALREILDRAGMERNRGGGGLLVLQPEILRLLVHGDHVVALVEDGLDDVVGGLVAQVLVRNEDVPHRGLTIVRVHAPVSHLRDDVLDVELAVFLVHRSDGIGVVDHPDLYAGRVGEGGHGRSRQPAHPEEGVDLSVLERVHRLCDAEPLALLVAGLFEAPGLPDAETPYLRRPARGARASRRARFREERMRKLYLLSLL